MRIPLVLTLLAPLAVAMAGTVAAREPTDLHVRPLTAPARAVLADAIARSALIRSQVEALERSDIVVYVTDAGPMGRTGPKGYLQFLGAAGGRRYLIIWLERWVVAPNDRIALLGHELHHALEVSASPVRDLAAFEALYRAIGRESHDLRFETEGARQATLRVRRELAAGQPVA
jgi:hypothetical protein